MNIYCHECHEVGEPEVKTSWGWTCNVDTEVCGFCGSDHTSPVDELIDTMEYMGGER